MIGQLEDAGTLMRSVSRGIYGFRRDLKNGSAVFIRPCGAVECIGFLFYDTDFRFQSLWIYIKYQNLTVPWRAVRARRIPPRDTRLYSSEWWEIMKGFALVKRWETCGDSFVISANVKGVRNYRYLRRFICGNRNLHRV